jgi:hypothetical protein
VPPVELPLEDNVKVWDGPAGAGGSGWMKLSHGHEAGGEPGFPQPAPQLLTNPGLEGVPAVEIKDTGRRLVGQRDGPEGHAPTVLLEQARCPPHCSASDVG